MIRPSRDLHGCVCGVASQRRSCIAARSPRVRTCRSAQQTSLLSKKNNPGEKETVHGRMLCRLSRAAVVNPSTRWWWRRCRSNSLGEGFDASTLPIGIFRGLASSSSSSSMSKRNASGGSPPAAKRAKPEIPEYHLAPSVREDDGSRQWPAPRLALQRARSIILEA